MSKLKKTIELGDDLPKISLQSDNDGKVALESFKGKKNVVLYFYPKDNTSGCTKQACAFQENLKKFDKSNTVVIGVSPDNLTSHEKFRKKYDLDFTLLSDEGKDLANLFGVWVEKSMYGRKYMGIQRSTFLFDKKGKLSKIWEKVKVDGHVEEVLEASKSIK